MRRLSLLLRLLLAGALAFAGWMAVFAFSPLATQRDTVDFTIQSGTPLRTISRQMVEAGLQMTDWQFTLLGRILGKTASIKAGSYEVRAGVTPLLLLEKLTRGDVTQADIVLLEGWTFRQMRATIDAAPALRHDTAGWTEQQLLKALRLEGQAEGQFFPDTYLFAKGSSDLEIYARAARIMQKTLQTEWQGRDPGLPLKTPYEALILASIVEKETGLPIDRPHIASVFINRLRKGMLLQTDPTVIYGLGERFDGNLRKKDLLEDSPYNTYTRAGLPLTPISMPGLASIQAVLHPARSDLLYFVARGDGSSHFSRTLEEHNHAVAKYQLKKRQ